MVEVSDRNRKRGQWYDVFRPFYVEWFVPSVEKQVGGIEQITTYPSLRHLICENCFDSISQYSS